MRFHGYELCCLQSSLSSCPANRANIIAFAQRRGYLQNRVVRISVMSLIHFFAFTMVPARLVETEFIMNLKGRLVAFPRHFAS
jgi:hypothetical protein